MMRAVLTYHSLDESRSAISIAPAVFETHFQWLTSGRVRVLPLGDLATAADGDAVAVTFDDGFLNTRFAVERLLKDGVPVTLFVVTGRVGETNMWGGRPHPGIPTLPLLGWHDLEFLRAHGAAVEAHTRSHPPLTGKSAAEVDEELQGCLTDLEARLGVRSEHLAYPYGAVDDLVAGRAAESFRFAHTTEYRCMGTNENPVRMPRLDAYYLQSPGAFDEYGTPAFARRVAWVRAKRRVRARVMANAMTGYLLHGGTM
jgi:peptidoglycan/xylan/chitin deacetylase (PgdA/CDA1 family)